MLSSEWALHTHVRHFLNSVKYVSSMASLWTQIVACCWDGSDFIWSQVVFCEFALDCTIIMTVCYLLLDIYLSTPRHKAISIVSHLS
jgi:hypothetical protein